MWFLALQPSGDSFFKENKQNKKKGEKKKKKNEAERRKPMLSYNPSLAIFFLIKNWNDETRTAITAHSPPLSPMHEQVTNK